MSQLPGQPQFGIPTAEQFAKTIFNQGNCGVVGCWGKDANGNDTLNGQPFVKNTPISKNTDGTKPVPTSTEKLLPIVGIIAAGILLVYIFFFKKD